MGGRKDDLYGKENFNDSFHQQIKTTPYSYAKSLLSILYAYRGWYESTHTSESMHAKVFSGKTQIMLGLRSRVFDACSSHYRYCQR